MVGRERQLRVLLLFTLTDFVAVDTLCGMHYTSCMVASQQIHIRLAPEDLALLRKIAENEQRTPSDTIRQLIRRAAAALKVT